MDQHIVNWSVVKGLNVECQYSYTLKIYCKYTCAVHGSKTTRLPCWPSRGPQVLRQRWIWGIFLHTGNDAYKWGDLAWNPGHTWPEIQNRGISSPTKRTCVLQTFQKEKEFIEKHAPHEYNGKFLCCYKPKIIWGYTIHYCNTLCRVVCRINLSVNLPASRSEARDFCERKWAMSSRRFTLIPLILR